MAASVRRRLPRLGTLAGITGIGARRRPVDVGRRHGDNHDDRDRAQAPTWRPRLFRFPNPVNEVSARLVAGGVVLLALATIALDHPWLTAVLAYGFVARVLTGAEAEPPRPARDRGSSLPVSGLRRSWCPDPRSGLRKRSASSSRSPPQSSPWVSGCRRRGLRRARSPRRRRHARVGVRGTAWGARCSRCSCAAGFIPAEVCERCSIWARTQAA